jgi:arsenate reductase (thioredoxin)
MGKTRVLFVCTSNTARSQMAEAFLKKYAADRYDVFSAGLGPGPMNPLTTAVMEENGISMRDHYPKGIEGFLAYDFAFVIVVCSRAETVCPVFPDSCIRLYWPFDDPEDAKGSQDEKLAKFREIRDQIDAKIRQWLQERKI